jgi:4-alpha-glucanotransferase
MTFPRASGILCHPTSFPSRYGIGDLGQGAYDFLDWLVAAKQQLWQVLPLGPTGYGDSPYQSFSAFAGNPLLISPDSLAYAGLLPQDALTDAPAFPAGKVDFGAAIPYKQKLFRQSYAHFKAQATNDQHNGFAGFRAKNAAWLPDFALFMAVKAHFGGGSWHGWARDILVRYGPALDYYRRTLADEIAYYEYLQWQFAEQWRSLKARAASQGIQIIGDSPIFVAEDSADVWSRPELFTLDEERNPIVIAGVPPDNFSATGQRWGNPHYRWDVMAQTGYAWWIERIRHTLSIVDIVRIDHFRGFEAAWEIPADEPTAIKGRWVKGPGPALFEAINAALGKLPIIAEDLGVITPEVDALRTQFNFPGMKILQFGFALDNNPKYLPHTFDKDYIVYPGTHDNNTVIGWFNEAIRTGPEKWNCLRYLGTDGHDLAWDFIRTAWGSVANQAVACLQDVMSLGNEARMNFPSTSSGNWQWRYTPEMLTDAQAARLRELTEMYDRAVVKVKKEAVATVSE